MAGKIKFLLGGSGQGGGIGRVGVRIYTEPNKTIELDPDDPGDMEQIILLRRHPLVQEIPAEPAKVYTREELEDMSLMAMKGKFKIQDIFKLNKEQIIGKVLEQQSESEGEKVYIRRDLEEMSADALRARFKIPSSVRLSKDQIIESILKVQEGA